MPGAPFDSAADWTGATTSAGQTLGALSEESPVLLVFLRHGGCPFCRQTLADIRAQRAAIEARGVRIVLVHLMTPADGADLFARSGVGDLAHVSDPDGRLYAACGMQRGGLWQIAGPEVWWSGFWSTVAGGHLPGMPRGDVFQLPGACLAWKRRIVARHAGRNSADAADLMALSECPLPPP